LRALDRSQNTWLRAKSDRNLLANVDRFIQSLKFEVLDKFVIGAKPELCVPGTATALQSGPRPSGSVPSADGDKRSVSSP
jgi:hypothetical protein